MKIAITGHRPDKLNKEWDGVGPCSDFIRSCVSKVLERNPPSLIISGMALGVDMLFAEMAIERNLPLLAAIPCKDQERMWPTPSKLRYRQILGYENCETHYVSESYSGYAMQKRNEYMVDNCDILIGIFDGTKGGTYNCLQYAKKKKTRILLFNPMDYKESETGFNV